MIANSLIFCAAIVCFLFLYLYLYRTYYNYWKDRGIPYDKPYLFFGNLGFIMRKSVWDYCFELRKRHPVDYVGIFLGWRPALMIQTPEFARNILRKDFEYFQDRSVDSNATDPLGSLNLFTVKNPLWKNIRHELTPMFTPMRLKILTELMNLNARELVLKVKRDYIDTKNTANLKELFSMYVSDTVAYTVFGIRVSILNDQKSPLWYITRHMAKWTFWRGLEFNSIFLMPAVASVLSRSVTVPSYTSMIANSLIFCAAIVCFLFLYLYLYRTYYNYWKDRGIPYDKPYLFFGNLGFIMRKSVWDYCFELRKRHPVDYVGIFLGWRPALMIQTPEFARNILRKDFEYFQDRSVDSNATDPLGSLNLFTVKNPLWKNIRHELTPMFTPMRLKILTELMNLNARELVLKVKRDYIDTKNTANLKELFSMYVSDTVAYTVFGIRVSILNDQKSPLWYITRHMAKWTFWRGLEFNSIFLMPAVASVLRVKFFSKEATAYIKMLFSNVVEERKKAENVYYKDMVSYLLSLKEKLELPVGADSQLSDDIMLAQAAAFIFGSVETSSSTLSYCLHELAYHPEEQATLYNEIAMAVKDDGNDILEYNKLLELKYLTACLHETLRKYPPLGYLDRLCQKDYKMNDQVTIEKGLPVFINVLAIHYDENYFPDPEEWRPERFTSYTEGDNLNYTFIPFGEGPRYCIGKRYGMMQMRAALSQLILKYKVEPEVPYSVTSDPYSYLLAPKKLSVKFIER